MRVLGARVGLGADVAAAPALAFKLLQMQAGVGEASRRKAFLQRVEVLQKMNFKNSDPRRQGARANGRLRDTPTSWAGAGVLLPSFSRPAAS